MRTLQIIQREDPGDQEKVERFIKVWVFCYFNALHLEQIVTVHREALTTNSPFYIRLK
jgi:hypothetical protein